MPYECRVSRHFQVDYLLAGVHYAKREDHNGVAAVILQVLSINAAFIQILTVERVEVSAADGSIDICIRYSKNGQVQDIVDRIAGRSQVANHVIAANRIVLSVPRMHVAFADRSVFVFNQCALRSIDADGAVAAVDACQMQLLHTRIVETDTAVVVREGIYLYALHYVVFRVNSQRQMVDAVITRSRLTFYVYLMRADRQVGVGTALPIHNFAFAGRLLLVEMIAERIYRQIQAV